MGEYARSLAIARACQSQWPKARLHFMLSQEAPYAANVPFPATLLQSSPTFHTKAVIALMNSFQPTVVIFDNAGRTAQLRAARRCGARVVYISARARQRRKAFRWRWLNLLDAHWIAYPEFIAGSLTAFERFKLRWHRRVNVRFLDVILSPDNASSRTALFAAGSFALLVPGGGTGHPRARDAVQQFESTARALAAQGIPTVMVGVVGAAAPSLTLLPSLPQVELAQLLREARLVIANGGSTLLQAIASGAACVAVPIADDQAARIRHCVQAEVAVEAELDSTRMLAAVLRLWNDEPARRGLAQRAANLQLADGVQVAITGLKELVNA
jgi:hypothetical protein